MTEELEDKLVASFDDVSEAELARSVLEGEGIGCRVGALGHVPHVMGEFGVLGSRAGVWVPAAELERARAVLADLQAATDRVDPAALADEAVAARMPEPVGRADGPRFSRTVQWVAGVFFAVTLAGLLLRFLLR